MSTILPDFLTRVRPTVDLTIQPVAPTKDVQEALSRLVSGQRVFAEILNALPNGTYRAVVSQREMVLALPFSAKTGDSLELQVVHTDGKVAFAVVAGRADAQATPAATTTLSPAAQLISQLIGRAPEKGAVPEQAALLASAKPLLGTPPSPQQATALAPVLQQAISDSGLFFEAHQARWIDGRYPLASLLREPQQHLAGQRPGGAGPLAEGSALAAATARAAPPVPSSGVAASSGGAAAANAVSDAAVRQGATALAATAEARTGNALGLPKEVLPMVQQQLQSLETGHYVWHGQVWPGQTMDWEIIDDQPRQRDAQDGDDGTWKTQLRLRFPELGAIAAEIRLRGQNLEVTIAATEGRPVLESGLAALRTQFEAAGLNLTGVKFKAADADA